MAGGIVGGMKGESNGFGCVRIRRRGIGRSSEGGGGSGGSEALINTLPFLSVLPGESTNTGRLPVSNPRRKNIAT